MNFETSPFTCNEIKEIDLDKNIVRSIYGESITYNKLLVASGMIEPLFNEDNVYNVFDIDNHSEMREKALISNKIVLIGSSIEIY